MTRSIVALSFAAGLCAAPLAPANAGGHGGGGFHCGGFHGGGFFHGGFFHDGFHHGGCCFRGGFWWPGVSLGLGFGAPYYYPPPFYYPSPPVYYAPPQAYYQPPPQAYSQAPPVGSGGQSCYAGAYVCPMDRPVATGASCYCPGNNGQRVGGRAS
jgi:hypothetical protein